MCLGIRFNIFLNGSLPLVVVFFFFFLFELLFGLAAGGDGGGGWWPVVGEEGRVVGGIGDHRF